MPAADCMALYSLPNQCMDKLTSSWDLTLLVEKKDYLQAISLLSQSTTFLLGILKMDLLSPRLIAYIFTESERVMELSGFGRMPLLFLLL